MGLIELLHRLQDTDGRPDGSLRVVLVSHRGAEDGKHTVSHELFEAAPKPFDVLTDPGVIDGEAVAAVLGIGALGVRGEADQVGKEDRDDPALLGWYRWGWVVLGKSFATVRAESRPGLHRCPAPRAAANESSTTRSTEPGIIPSAGATRRAHKSHAAIVRTLSQVADPNWVLALGESLDEVHYRLGVLGRVEVPGLDMLGTLELDQRDQIRASPSKLAAGADRN